MGREKHAAILATPFYAPNLGPKRLKIVTDETFCYCGGFDKSRLKKWMERSFLTALLFLCSSENFNTTSSRLPHRKAVLVTWGHIPMVDLVRWWIHEGQ